MLSGTQPDSPVGGDGVETGASSAAPGLTAGSVRGRTPETAESKSAAEEMAEYIRFAINRWRQMNDPADPDGISLETEIARVLETAGWRRVSVDDDTVQRIADAIALGYVPVAGPVDPREYYRIAARAAVQALRDGAQPKEATQ